MQEITSSFAFFSANPPIFLTFIAFLGLCLGSFLNVVILRLPKMLEQQWRADCRTELELPADPDQTRFNLLLPRSCCPKCGHQISAWENLPIISYLILRGRCAGCKTPISLQYPMVELSSAVLSVVIAYHFGPTLACLAALVLTWGLLALTVIDFNTSLLPDNITYPLLWLGLLLNLNGLFTDIHSSLLGAVFGYLALWSVFWVFKLITGKEGMGYGDFKLLALLGAWMGWQMLPLIILVSSLIGALVGISLVLFRNHQRDQAIPFGPYLAAAGWVALLWGEFLTYNYIKLLS